jgi:hypothetical protein
MKSFALLFSAALLLTGACRSARQNASPEAAQDGVALEFRTLAEGSYSAAEEASQVLISRLPEWQAFWTRLHANRSPEPPLPQVDFATETVLACTCGSRNSGGFRVKVASLAYSGELCLLSLLYTEPGSGCFTTEALTQPYHIVVFRKTGLTQIKLEVKTEKTPC